MVLPSGLCELVGADENLARFLTSSRYFNASGVIKAVAYLPNPQYGNTSVYRCEQREMEQVWEIADEQITGRTVHGVAFCSASVVRGTGLDVVAEEPPPKHANIVDWPCDQNDPKMSKSSQMELAAVIASQATLAVR